MTALNSFSNVYFVGIGGIGMSALARYFKMLGKNVAGYDKTPSPLTQQLENEGINIHFEDLGASIPAPFQTLDETLVVFTPAIPAQMQELVYFQSNGYTCMKRSEVLGLITRNSRGLGVAGTHGKTTTSSLLAHILHQSIGCSAFLGGISSNFESNFIFSENSDLTVIEADEFDRSFLRLSPFASIITSTDADHLDIYGDSSTFLEGFQKYVDLIDENGLLIVKKGLPLKRSFPTYTYSIEEEADYTATNLRSENGRFKMDVKTPNETWENMELGLPGIHNAENALACIVMCQFLGLNESQIREGLSSFKGVKRRFEYHLRSENLIYIDDYAHHPTEIRSLLSSVRLLYPTMKITGIFQPHLFSRTRDFIEDFAAELSKLDELILLPIYPAREEPIAGITSEKLLELSTCTEQTILNPSEVLEKLATYQEGVVLTIGAGDIDRLVPSISTILHKNTTIEK
jgi:UDP-N-acetylmuramate--alanine ligase